MGRYGNRIRGGKFAIDGHEYQIPPNNNGNALHGGPHGFDEQLWTGKEIPDGVEMSLVSPDGDMGFPGTLTAHVRYTLVGTRAAHQLLGDHRQADGDEHYQPLLLQPFRRGLGHDPGRSADDQCRRLHAGGCRPDPGRRREAGRGNAVRFPQADCRSARASTTTNEQLKIAGGYDHNWVLNGNNGEMKLAAKVFDPKTGRVLTVSTTQPGVQFYSGNFLDGSYKGKAGAKYTNAPAFAWRRSTIPTRPTSRRSPARC